jgi:hypothetical protein
MQTLTSERSLAYALPVATRYGRDTTFDFTVKEPLPRLIKEWYGFETSLVAFEP